MLPCLAYPPSLRYQDIGSDRVSAAGLSVSICTAAAVAPPPQIRSIFSTIIHWLFHSPYFIPVVYVTLLGLSAQLALSRYRFGQGDWYLPDQRCLLGFGWIIIPYLTTRLRHHHTYIMGHHQDIHFHCAKHHCRCHPSLMQRTFLSGQPAMTSGIGTSPIPRNPPFPTRAWLISNFIS